MTRRVLIIGSRPWAATTIIHPGLAAGVGRWHSGTGHRVSPPRGADHLAELAWMWWGGLVERHPAEWNRYGRSAGGRASATEMVAAGAGRLPGVHPRRLPWGDPHRQASRSGQHPPPVATRSSRQQRSTLDVSGQLCRTVPRRPIAATTSGTHSVVLTAPSCSSSVRLRDLLT